MDAANKKGFSLAEVLTVTGILGLIVSIIVLTLNTAFGSFGTLSLRLEAQSEARRFMHLIMVDLRQTQASRISIQQPANIRFAVNSGPDIWVQELEYNLAVDDQEASKFMIIRTDYANPQRQPLKFRNVESLNFDYSQVSEGIVGITVNIQKAWRARTINFSLSNIVRMRNE